MITGSFPKVPRAGRMRTMFSKGSEELEMQLGASGKGTRGVEKSSGFQVK